MTGAGTHKGFAVWPPMPWADRAACASRPDVNFHPSKPTMGGEALAVCCGCPVRSECLAYALEQEATGVWGGTTETERDAIRRRRKR